MQETQMKPKLPGWLIGLGCALPMLGLFAFLASDSAALLHSSEKGTNYIYTQFWPVELGPEYVCADGTPFRYWVRRPAADSPNFNKWVIEIEGGHSCVSDESCAAEVEEFDPYYVSTITTDSYSFSSGIKSTDADKNQRFFDYSMVWLHACNGDNYLGQAPVGHSANPTEWSFTGAINMWATFDDLMSEGNAFDQKRPESVLIVGNDVGAIAIMNQEARLYDYFSNKLIPIKFVLDAGYFPEAEEYRCYGTNCHTHFDNANRVHAPQLHAACEAAGYFYECYYADPFGFSFVTHKADMLVLNSLFDNKAINDWADPAGDTLSGLTLEEWENQRAAYLLYVMRDSTPGSSGLLNFFIHNCWKHAVSNKADWNQLLIEEISPMEAVWSFENGQMTIVKLADEDLTSDGNPTCQDAIDRNFPGNNFVHLGREGNLN
jgi:hypothetical protein